MPRPDYFADGRYKAWRKAVLKRDGHKCRMCGSTKKLEIHHIRPWSQNPELRHSVGNGITLCQADHRSVTGREEEFVEKLLALRGGASLMMARIRARKDNE